MSHVTQPKTRYGLVKKVYSVATKSNSCRYLATSIPGFIQQLSVGFVARGYFFFVTGRIPARKDPLRTDRKLIERYGIDRSVWERQRRKRAGIANVQYLRHEDVFVLVSTHGQSRFFEEEQPRDCRESPIRVFGYAVSSRPDGLNQRKRRAHVRMEKEQYLCLKAYFEEIATRHPAEWLAREINQLPFLNFAPVRRQKLCVIRAVNCRRQAAGLDEVPLVMLHLRRKIVRPFE